MIQTDREFTAKAVCRAAGVERGTLNTWRKRGFLKVQKDSPMAWTRYSTADALRVCVLGRLVRSGLDLRLASQVVEGLEERGVIADALGKTHLYAAISQIELNVDRPRAPKGPAYRLVWGRSFAKLLRASGKDVPAGDAVTVVIDLAKITRAARVSLAEED